MTIRTLLKKAVNLLPARFKNKAYRASAIIFGLNNLSALPIYDMYHHIENLKKLGFNPDLIIDGGACFGNWTESVLNIFPKATFVMIEAQIAQKSYLEQLTKKFDNVSLELALVGDVEKDNVDFYEMGTGSSIYNENTYGYRQKVSLKMQTLDSIIKKRHKMPTSCFLKLDVQGAELDVLKGATQLLKHTEFILLEISTLNYNNNAPQFTDAIIFLKGIGFVLFDICDERRMANEVLYQTDMIFVKESSAIRSAVDFKKSLDYKGIA
jgi:FkbM family methyltransferase